MQFKNDAILHIVLYNKADLQKLYIKLGMQWISNYTCIRFVPKTNADKNYLNIISSNGFWSGVKTC